MLGSRLNATDACIIPENLLRVVDVLIEVFMLEPVVLKC